MPERSSTGITTSLQSIVELARQAEDRCSGEQRLSDEAVPPAPISNGLAQLSELERALVRVGEPTVQ